MARYTGAVCRLCRRYGDKLYLKGDRCLSPKCAFERRPSAPGQQKFARRRRVSDRALQLREKQRARFTYGLMERQFRRYYRDAVRRTGVTGETLLRLLEQRLDNVVYRLGFADSRPQARQIVRHGHIQLNGRVTDIPSCSVKIGDEITWSTKGRQTELFKFMQEGLQAKEVPDWLGIDAATMAGRVVTQPDVAQVGAKFDPAVIVEYYSR
ncbi:MAG: 30S ribosomal protein S4 [Chloroflexi bacterium RBG_16_68_14]|nr:MAG: 30S ribosomal protein S4 [Chloroflexi bacterium RBG_16_68_14]